MGLPQLFVAVPCGMGWAWRGLAVDSNCILIKNNKLINRHRRRHLRNIHPPLMFVCVILRFCNDVKQVPGNLSINWSIKVRRACVCGAAALHGCGGGKAQRPELRILMASSRRVPRSLTSCSTTGSERGRQTATCRRT